MSRRLPILLLVVVSACGGQSAGTQTSSTSMDETTTTTGANGTTTIGDTTTTQPDLTTTAAETYDITLEGGNDEVPEVIVHGPGRFSYAPGDEVSITVLSSVDGDLHLHGYDLHFQLVEGEVTEVSLVADVPGIFEAELEENHQLIFELEVTP